MRQPLTSYLLSALLFSSINQDIYASTTTIEANAVFDAAETQFSEIFNDKLNTMSLNGWPFFRGPYPNNVYIGINTEDQVYTLGGVFGDTPVKQGEIDNVKDFLNIVCGHNEGSTVIDMFADAGLDYIIEGNVVTQTTHGQCIKSPIYEFINKDYDFCTVIQTDLLDQIDQVKFPEIYYGNVLTTVLFYRSEFHGFFDENGNEDLSFNEEDSYSSCDINSFNDLSIIRIDTDTCYDITDSYEDLSMLITMVPPVTHTIRSSTTYASVTDCFSTGADSIFDFWTSEHWEKNDDGSYTKY